MTYESIKQPKISDSIVQQIERHILEGIIKPGDRLPSERDLAQQLAVSRTSLRDALVRLESKGLIQPRPGGGSYVIDILGPTMTDPLVHLLKEQPKALLDLVELRQTLEEFSAYNAAERRTEADIKILTMLFNELEALDPTADPLNAAVVITEFHLAVADASHNIALMHVTRGLFNLMRTGINHSLELLCRNPDNYAAIHNYRRQLFQAICDQQPDDAKEAAQQLIQFINDTLQALDIQAIPTLADNPFAPLEPHNSRTVRLSDTLVDRLEKLLIDGILKPGDKLPSETMLAKKFQISRTVLRDAVAKLEAKGLLQTKRGGGTFVRDVLGQTITDPLVNLLKEHQDAMYDFLDLRRALEGMAAYYACLRMTESDKASLTTCFNQLTASSDGGDPYREADIDTEFHIAIAEASHNTALVYVIRGLFNLLHGNIRRNLQRLAVLPSDYQKLSQQHKAIYDAVLSQHPDKAREAAHHHLTFVDKTIRAMGDEERRLASARRRLDIYNEHWNEAT